ncbi:MAG: hypothetical protein OXF11_05765 [Deltaproteobacteria bacterium]|nr:hypothetical protein [Deltaproteobacteria bacterium]
MIRHEGGAAPENLRILRVRGDSLAPEMRDGNGLVVKRVEAAMTMKGTRRA